MTADTLDIAARIEAAAKALHDDEEQEFVRADKRVGWEAASEGDHRVHRHDAELVLTAADVPALLARVAVLEAAQARVLALCDEEIPRGRPYGVFVKRVRRALEGTDA